jgi:hypothetical protein
MNLKPSKPLRLAAITAVLAALGAAGLIGCSQKVSGTLVPNQPPTVELTNAPVSKDVNSPYFYAYRVNWSGNDPDGRVDHYEYAIDPPHLVVRDTSKCNNGDTCWITTTKNEEILFFHATQPDSIKGTNPPTASDPHTFVIRAVDNMGARSPYKTRSFYSYTIAPTVNIVNPLPSALLRAQVTPSVRVEWEGQDPDGQFTQKPVKYKYLMLDLDDPKNSVFLADPDSLRRQESAKNWAGWDSTRADTQFVQFTNLTPGKSYMFVLIGFDEAGAYSPVFSLNSNCLQLTAGFASSNGPRIHIFNEFIDYVYQSGGYTTDPLREIPVEIPTRAYINVNWEAFPSPGSRIQYFRWMVDGNINDQTPRSDEANDYIHWSQPSPTMPGAVTLRPFTDGDHRFYLECGDNNGQKSLGILKMTAVTPTFNRNLLVIDDTRREPDKIPLRATRPNPYTLPWPSRTELDTFLFAKGGYPWRGTQNPPDNTGSGGGAISQPGLFAGYEYDTLGTRLGLENPARGVLLSRIGQYKNLVWLVDNDGVTKDFINPDAYPITALKAMSGPGLASTLEAYTQLGGRVWLAGGGAAYGSLILFDKRTNNQGQTTVFSSLPQFAELGPSRIMYDGAHWQSSVAVTQSLIQTSRYDYSVKVKHPDDTVHDTTYIVAPAWQHPDHYNPGTNISSPDYSKLPQQMRPKAGVDDMPPTRLATQTGLFYQTSFPCEYILDINAIIEDVDPDPLVSREIAVLDTLYMAYGGVLLTAPNPAPTMTYYHGSTAHQFVFTGFSIWSYARQDCMGLVDFVLQDLWNLPRQNIDRGSITPATPKGVSRPTRVVTPATRAVSARVPSGATRE